MSIDFAISVVRNLLTLSSLSVSLFVDFHFFCVSGEFQTAPACLRHWPLCCFPHYYYLCLFFHFFLALVDYSSMVRTFLPFSMAVPGTRASSLAVSFLKRWCQVLTE